mmetsp:Transcript_24287/g.74166  ORF Transcript_24287/g.74166 Transcript_24287/m.74166 type:complete len:248 (+) Transcript_24287:532-1275(+)
MDAPFWMFGFALSSSSKRAADIWPADSAAISGVVSQQSPSMFASACTSRRTTSHEPGASSATERWRGDIKSRLRSLMRPVRPQPAASKAATTTDRPASAARCRGESLLSSRESPWYGIAKSCALGRRSLRSISMSPCMTATWSGVRPRASRAWCRACHSANPAEEAAAMSACTASGCAAGLWRALSSFWPFSAWRLVQYSQRPPARSQWAGWLAWSVWRGCDLGFSQLHSRVFPSAQGTTPGKTAWR